LSEAPDISLNNSATRPLNNYFFAGGTDRPNRFKTSCKSSQATRFITGFRNK
jgi:hypothetical protein